MHKAVLGCQVLVAARNALPLQMLPPLIMVVPLQGLRHRCRNAQTMQLVPWLPGKLTCLPELLDSAEVENGTAAPDVSSECLGFA